MINPACPELDAIGDAILDARGDGRRCCPDCGCEFLIGWGRARGRKRFRCQGCLRTFTPFTGTPLAWLESRVVVDFPARV